MPSMAYIAHASQPYYPPPMLTYHQSIPYPYFNTYNNPYGYQHVQQQIQNQQEPSNFQSTPVQIVQIKPVNKIKSMSRFGETEESNERKKLFSWR